MKPHFFLMVLALSLTGFGAAPRQQLDPNKIYRREIQLEVNGLKGEGVLVALKSSKYVIKGKSKNDFDLLTISTCHRDFKAEKLGNEFEYEYEPVSGLEDMGGCPLRISGFDAKGAHSWGLVDFEDDLAKAQATLKCNGVIREAHGVSVCQSREGLIQEIKFMISMRISPDQTCPMPLASDEKTFQFPIAPKECVYAFMSLDGQIHRLTTIGYQGILLED